MPDLGGIMKRSRKFAVDFYLAGTIIVKARNREEAIKKASSADIDALVDGIENSAFGKDYVEQI